MLRTLSETWWVHLLRGAMAVIFGVVAWAWPSLALEALVVLFGIYALADGTMALLTLFRGRHGPWWAHVVDGLVSLAAGVIALAWPGITAVALVIVIATWALLGGAAQIVTAVRLRRLLEREWLMMLNGVLAIAFAVLLLALPSTGLVSLVWLLGLYAIVAGVALIVFGVRLRRWDRRLQATERG